MQPSMDGLKAVHIQERGQAANCSLNFDRFSQNCEFELWMQLPYVRAATMCPLRLPHNKTRWIVGVTTP
jgi:hypothetical protein